MRIKIVSWETGEYEYIKSYVIDHYASFGTYPIEVKTDTQLYTFDQYWAILDDEDFHYTDLE